MSFIPCPTGHVICPYNKSHVIRTERMQFHLTKCMSNAGDNKQFVVCPFNSTHLIPASEINNHKTNLCPDRILLDTFLYDVAGSKPLFEVKKMEVECEENWDDDTGYTYNPEEVLNEKKLLVLKQCVPPSERKRFNAEQRRKFQSFPDDEPISVSQNNKLKIRPPNSKSIAETGPVKTEVKQEVKVVENKMSNININEKENDKKSNDEFELVVGKKKNKKTNRKEAVKPIESEIKKNEQKVVQKQPIKNTNENVKVLKVEPKNEEIKENITVEPKEDEFIVVTKKKNKSRKH